MEEEEIPEVFSAEEVWPFPLRRAFSSGKVHLSFYE